MLPEFATTEVRVEGEPEPYRLLPPGLHHCDETQLKASFVEAFAESTTRAAIHAGFSALRSDAVELGFAGTQWVNGSFVTTKMNPNDVDLITVLDYESANAFNGEQLQFAQDFLSGDAVPKTKYRSHTFVVLRCPPDHPYFPTYEASRNFWLTFWGCTRPLHESGSVVEKGILELELGAGSEPPAPDQGGG